MHAEAMVRAPSRPIRSDRFRTTNGGEAALREPAEPDRARTTARPDAGEGPGKGRGESEAHGAAMKSASSSLNLPSSLARRARARPRVPETCLAKFGRGASQRETAAAPSGDDGRRRSTADQSADGSGGHVTRRPPAQA